MRECTDTSVPTGGRPAVWWLGFARASTSRLAALGTVNEGCGNAIRLPPSLLVFHRLVFYIQTAARRTRRSLASLVNVHGVKAKKGPRTWPLWTTHTPTRTGLGRGGGAEQKKGTRQKKAGNTTNATVWVGRTKGKAASPLALGGRDFSTSSLTLRSRYGRSISCSLATFGNSAKHRSRMPTHERNGRRKGKRQWGRAPVIRHQSAKNTQGEAN